MSVHKRLIELIKRHPGYLKAGRSPRQKQNRTDYIGTGGSPCSEMTINTLRIVKCNRSAINSAYKKAIKLPIKEIDTSKIHWFFIETMGFPAGSTPDTQPDGLYKQKIRI